VSVVGSAFAFHAKQQSASAVLRRTLNSRRGRRSSRLDLAPQRLTCTFAFDQKAGGQQLLQRLEREFSASDHIAFSQNPALLCDASMGFAELVSTRPLRHPDHPQLNAHVLAASARFVGERWRFARPVGKHRWIDGLTAAMIAVAHTGMVEPEPVWAEVIAG
jgi:hypothetical protein